MNHPDQILMTADAVGGVWTYALELSRALTRSGTRVTLATMGPRPTDEQRREAAGISGLDLVESDWKLEWADDPWDDVDRAGDWLLRLEQRLRPDIVHLNGYAHGSLRWEAPSVAVAHSCVVSWWHAVHQCEPPASWSRYKERVRAGLLGADAVVAVSRFMSDELARHYGFRTAAVIPNGRSPEQYRDADPGNRDLILTSGRAWDAAKNISVLTSIASRLTWPVYLAGEIRPPHGNAADPGALHWLGRLNSTEMSGWLSRAGIYVLPALYEPFGLSVLEAALSGCALVLGDIPSLRELWQDAAVFVNGRDPNDVAAALESLIASPPLRNEIAHRARRRAIRYTPERMARSYLEIYSHALRQHRSAKETETSCAL